MVLTSPQSVQALSTSYLIILLIQIGANFLLWNILSNVSLNPKSNQSHFVVITIIKICVWYIVFHIALKQRKNY